MRGGQHWSPLDDVDGAAAAATKIFDATRLTFTDGPTAPWVTDGAAVILNKVNGEALLLGGWRMNYELGTTVLAQNATFLHLP